MDADNPLAIALARPLFRLPYTPANIRFDRISDGISFTCERTSGPGIGAQFDAVYHPQGPIYTSCRGSLEHWLTERYCYFGASKNHTYRCKISHRPWPLQRANAYITSNTLAESLGLRPEPVEPTLHYAHKMTALIWKPQRIR